MARPLRIELAGGIHHVTARASSTSALFRDDTDRKRFLDYLGEVACKLRWSPLSYCLMGTHYHLLVETPQPNLSAGMRDLNGSFAQWRNRRDGTRGPVFAGRFYSGLVQHDRHLLAASRYIVLNPVEAGLCDRPEDWAWSSHRAACAGRSTPVLNAERLLGFFGNPETDARSRYRKFVEDTTPDTEGPNGSGVHGDFIFARAYVPPQLPSQEIPRRFLASRRPPLDEILASAPTEESVVAAHRVHGYLLKEIASKLGVHPSTVGRWVRASARDRT
jgi:putative transposase